MLARIGAHALSRRIEKTLRVTGKDPGMVSGRWVAVRTASELLKPAFLWLPVAVPRSRRGAQAEREDGPAATDGQLAARDRELIPKEAPESQDGNLSWKPGFEGNTEFYSICISQRSFAMIP